MKLARFEIHNFKGLHELALDWDDILVLIGENNCGKSSVLQALEWFLSGKKISDELLFCDRCCGEEHAIELIGHFIDLTNSEKSATAVRGRMYNDKWILKKRFWRDEVSKWQEQYYSYSEQEVFVGWPDNERSWRYWPDEYQPLIEEIPDKPTTPNTAAKETLRELVRQKRPDLVMVQADWQPNPGGGGSWKSNANSIIPRFIPVRAVHDASAETQSKDATPFGKIINLVVERKLMKRKEVKELKSQLEKVLDLFRSDPEHPEKRAEEIRDLEDEINRLLKRLMQARALIQTGEPPDIGPLLLPNTTIRLDDGFETDVEHQGHGLQRALLLSLLEILADLENQPEEEGEDVKEEVEVAGSEEGTEGEESYIRHTILAVEEPELYMHPQMERKMRDALYDLGASEHYQVICSTHSPVFLNMAEKHRAIVRLEKDWRIRQVTKRQVTSEIFSGDTALERKNRLRMVLDFDPSVNELFFAKRVVLVEGDTEVAVLAEAAKLMGIFDEHPHLRHDVTIINCHGKWTIPAFQQVLDHFQIGYFVLHDQDAENSPAFRANEVIGELLLSPKNRYMFVENLEQALAMDVPSKDRPIKALEHVRALSQSDAGFPKEFVEAVWLAYLGTEAKE